MNADIVPLSSLETDGRNANKGTERGRYALERSLEKLGAGRSILLDKNGKIIAGNKTAETAGEMGIEDVVIVRTTGDKLVAVMREDLDLDEVNGRARELAYADNRVGQLDLEFDPAVIAFDLEAGLDLSDWWKEDELTLLTADIGGGVGEAADAEPQTSRADELREEWGTELGQLWKLPSRTAGQAHYLICGDCTDKATVERVMMGEKAGAVVTDSPYGINREGIENDDPEGLRKLFDGCLSAMPVEDAVVINFQSPRLFPVWLDATRAVGHKFERALWFYDETDVTFPWRGWLMTSQIALVSSIGKPAWGEGVYHHDCYLVKTAGKQDDSGGHTTAKPLDVITDLIKHTVGTLYEPFAGSGTAIIAAENTARRARAIELDLGYCAVILDRYARAFGLAPELVP